MSPVSVDDLPLHGDRIGEQRGQPDREALALKRDDAIVLVVDVQERLARAMPPEALAQVEKNTAILMKAAARLGVPIIASEQYPKGLGPTLPSLRALMPEPPTEKLEFSCGASKDIALRLFKAQRRQVIVAGMEAHVCVFQTVRDLQLGGYRAFVPGDAICSRSEANKEIGLKLMEKAGATITSTETVVFDLLGAAGTPEFKELSTLLK